MEGTMQPAAAAVSKVIDNDDLLAEILLRLGLPTTLVRAAAVCRRWLCQASGREFLRRFRELHPPRLLGFYIDEAQWIGPTGPRFIPLLPLPSELAVVVRRVSSSLDTYLRRNHAGIGSTSILDCRNGRLLIERCSQVSRSTLAVLNLLCPERGLVAMARTPQRKDLSYYIHHEIISREEDNGDLSYLYVLIKVTTDRKYVVHVYVSKDGIYCCTHNLVVDQLPCVLPEPKSVLVDNKIYMAAAWSDILVLDLTSSRFSTIRLPHGVKHGERSTRLSSVYDAAGIYLIHVKELQLHIWEHKGDDWSLVDTFYLRDMLASLCTLVCNASLQIKQVEDNAEFVFLEIGRCALYLDIKCRTLHKVYEMTKGIRYFGDIHPLMMIWPPTFPTLKGQG